MIGEMNEQHGVIYCDDTMTRERLERKYKNRTEVWKVDVLKMADEYEKIIAGLRKQVEDLQHESAAWEKFFDEVGDIGLPDTPYYNEETGEVEIPY